MELLWSMNHTDNACANYPLFLTGALQEILYLNPPPYLGNPPHILETVQGSQKIPPQGPKKWPTWPPKKSLPSSYPQKIYFAKKMAQKGHLWPQQWSEQSTAAYMGEISQGVYFPQILSLFLQLWQLFSSTFCIGSIVSIISTGQSHVPQSGKPSFWPFTSG